MAPPTLTLCGCLALVLAGGPCLSCPAAVHRVAVASRHLAVVAPREPGPVQPLPQPGPPQKGILPTSETETDGAEVATGPPPECSLLFFSPQFTTPSGPSRSPAKVWSRAPRYLALLVLLI